MRGGRWLNWCAEKWLASLGQPSTPLPSRHNRRLGGTRLIPCLLIAPGPLSPPAVERLIAYWELPQEAPAKNPETEPEVGAGWGLHCR